MGKPRACMAPRCWAVAHLDHKLNPAVRVRFHLRLHPDQRLHMGIESVVHQVELAIGWDEGNGAIMLKPGQAHALQYTAT